MKFENLWLLNLLWLVPAAVFLLIYEARKKKASLEKLADANLLPLISQQHSKSRLVLKSILLLTALSLVITAIAGPKWGSHYQEVNQEGVDIIVAIDVSSSMLAQDIKPSRMERAKREVADFLKVVQGDRVGLVAFAGTAFLQCPLTLDYAALEMFLSYLESGLIPVLGTDLGSAIDTAVNAFDKQSNTDRVILLITDGEDNEGKAKKAAELAKENNVRIFVFGIGDTTGAPVPESDGGFVKDSAGRIVTSKLDEQSLKDISDATGGTYVRSTEGDLDLDVLYFSGIKMKTDASVLKSGKIKVYEEKFMVFLIIAFFLLILEDMVYTIPSKQIRFWRSK